MPAWEPFTEHARRSIVLAQEVAQRFGNSFIDGDHIFVGIVDEGQNGATQALASLGVTPEMVSEAAKTVIATGSQASEEMSFTPLAKRVIDSAFQEARDLQNNYIGAEHLMLGYLREFKEHSELLSALNLKSEDLRAKLLERVRPGARAPMPISLDDFFNHATTRLDTEELWRRMQSAVEFEDLGGALLYGFLLARRSGLNSRDAAEQLQKLLDEDAK
jgi:ATP-dependent Clp protease ATP-binding subunit ClpA